MRIILLMGSTNHQMRGEVTIQVAARFESAIRPTARPTPCPPKDDDQYCHQDHQQVVKVELKCRFKPLKVNELINQGNPLFIGKLLGGEARYEHGKVSNRLQYIEKHLDPPLIPPNYQYAGAAVRLILQECVRRRREGRLKDSYFIVWDGFGAGCILCNKGMENVLGWLVMTE